MKFFAESEHFALLQHRPLKKFIPLAIYQNLEDYCFFS